MKRRKKISVPRNYYYRVHETRYSRIFGSGARFRQNRMNPDIREAWGRFRSEVGLAEGALGVEFGSGTGINSVTVSLQGFRMVGLDISPTATVRARELARERGSGAAFMVGDMFNPPLTSESLDFVLNIWTLHAVGEQHLRAKHLSECHRVLRPGGYIFLHNESSEDDVLDPDEEIVIEETAEWNIPQHTNMFDLPGGGSVSVSFPGHMPPGLSGRRSLREHEEELHRAGFHVIECTSGIMKAHPSVPGNRVMAAFAVKEGSFNA